MFYQTIKDNGMQNVRRTTMKALDDLRYFYQLERSRGYRQEKNLFLLAGDTSRAHVRPILINPRRVLDARYTRCV